MKNLNALTTETAVKYGDLKALIELYTGLEKDALHIHAALLIYLLAMFVFRQNRRSRFPWLVVLAFELANEALDLRRAYVEMGRPADLSVLTWGESIKDLWNTMLWPTVLLVIGRYTDLFVRKGRPVEPDAPIEPEAEAQEAR